MSLESPVAEFRSPADEGEVVELLEQYGDRALIVAGGTFVHGLAARGLLAGTEALIDIQKLPLASVEADSEGLRAGATTKCATLARDPRVRSEPWLGAVADALSHLRPQIQNAATVGGALATACPFFDLPVAFMALDGAVEARGRGGTRRIALPDLFAGLFENSLQRGEFLVALRLPTAPPRSASGFEKLCDNANDLAIVNAGVRLTVDGAGACTDARVVVGGGVGGRPVRSASAERVLQGTRLDEGALRRAGEAATADLEPLSDHRASGAYRRQVAGVLVRRGLERALTRLENGGQP